MIKIANVQVVGMSHALDFRRSFNSQSKSDSYVNFETTVCVGGRGYATSESVSLGEVDLKRLAHLKVCGDSHAKVNRMIWVYHDLTLPRRVWVDFDTYRIGRLDGIRPDDIEYFSDSTMHTLGKTEVTPSDFDEYTCQKSIDLINSFVRVYNISKSDKDFLRLKSNLTEGFLQTRTVMLTYQAIRHIVLDRAHHRQPEFPIWCEWASSLPYAAELIL